jgi:uncharacterized protein
MGHQKTEQSNTATMERATEPQNGSIVHIEFTTPSLEKAKTFYADMFGWEFHPFQAKEWYFMTPKNFGPCGCMLEGAPATDGKTMIYVNVADIQKTLAKAIKLGAKEIKGKTEIPGGHGFFAQLKAPDGNIWGIFSK